MLKKGVKALAFISLPLLCTISCTSGSDSENYSFYPDYANRINPLSGITYDYANPNFGYLKLPTDGNEYSLNGEDTYKLVSQFNDLKFDNWEHGPSASEELLHKTNDSITILVSYKFACSETNQDDAIVYFYVCEDGTVILEGDKAYYPYWTYYYTESGVMDYEAFENYAARIAG